MDDRSSPRRSAAAGDCRPPIAGGRPARVQADGRGGGHVERLLAARLRDADVVRRPGLQRRRHALPFVPHQPGAGVRQLGLVQPLAAVRAGRDQRHLQASSASASTPSISRSPKWAPMPARSTLGAHSAAVPLSAITWVKPKAAALRRMEPALPASCRRSSTTLGASGCRSGRRQVEHETHGRGRLEPTDAAQQIVAHHHRLGGPCRPLGRRTRPERLRKHGHRGLDAPRQRRTAEVVALEPDPAQLAVSAWVLRELAQVLEQRVVARADVARAGVGGHQEDSGRCAQVQPHRPRTPITMAGRTVHHLHGQHHVHDTASARQRRRHRAERPR
jgi:hypothetical protein